jgi:hypothetical protein
MKINNIYFFFVVVVVVVVVSGHQPHQMVKRNQHFGNHLCLHHQLMMAQGDFIKV